jgi:hypothetical protein
MPHFDADQWSVLLITVIFGAARWIVAAFAVRPLERSEADHVARRRALHHQIAKAEHDADEWQAAMEALTRIAEPERPRPARPVHPRPGWSQLRRSLRAA